MFAQQSHLDQTFTRGASRFAVHRQPTGVMPHSLPRIGHHRRQKALLGLRKNRDMSRNWRRKIDDWKAFPVAEFFGEFDRQRLQGLLTGEDFCLRDVGIEFQMGDFKEEGFIPLAGVNDANKATRPKLSLGVLQLPRA